MLVAWSDETAVPDLAGLTAGLAGGSTMDVGSTRVYVSGVVVLDAPDLTEGLNVGDREGVGGVIRHELGHLVGLDHVDDPAELMHPEGVRGVVTFGPGDLTGLAQLGRGQCFPDL